MKIVVFLALATFCVAFPQKEGSAYTNEAIKQAQNTFLIPKDAQIQKVSLKFQLRFNKHVMIF